MLQDLHVLDDRATVAVDGVSLAVHAGEIFGIAGVQGNGQTELVETLTGLRSFRSGRICIGDADVTQAAPRRITMHGVAHIPEDRHQHGMVDGYSVADNLVLNVYHQRCRRLIFAHQAPPQRLAAYPVAISKKWWWYGN